MLLAMPSIVSHRLAAISHVLASRLGDSPPGTHLAPAFSGVRSHDQLCGGGRWPPEALSPSRHSAPARCHPCWRSR